MGWGGGGWGMAGVEESTGIGGLLELQQAN